MDPRATTLAAFDELAQALLAETSRTVAQRGAVRRVDAPRLLEAAAAREAFNASLQVLLHHAHSAFTTLCASVGAPATLAGLAATSPMPEVEAAVGSARLAAERLRAIDVMERSISERALAVVRGLSQRLPVRAAAYGKLGQAAPSPTTATTSTTA